MKRLKLQQFCGRFYLMIVLLFLYVPIFMMALMSFNESEFYQLPFKFSLRWYRTWLIMTLSWKRHGAVSGLPFA